MCGNHRYRPRSECSPRLAVFLAFLDYLNRKPCDVFGQSYHLSPSSLVPLYADVTRIVAVTFPLCHLSSKVRESVLSLCFPPPSPLSLPLSLPFSFFLPVSFSLFLSPLFLSPLPLSSDSLLPPSPFLPHLCLLVPLPHPELRFFLL